MTLVLAMSGAACSSQDSRLGESQKQLASLGESAAAITEGWLSGRVSKSYSVAALQTTFELVETERQTLASDPRALQDARGASLAQTQDLLSRTIAAMILDVQAGDGDAARRRVADIPIRATAQ